MDNKELLQKVELAKKQLSIILEPKAYERMMNIKNVNIERFLIVSQYLINLNKRVGRRIRDNELLTILQTMSGIKRETKISFKRK